VPLVCLSIPPAVPTKGTAPTHTSLLHTSLPRPARFLGLLLSLLVWAGPASAQEARNPLVPKGAVRLQASPEYRAFNSRFGRNSGAGAIIDRVELLGSELTAPGVGSGLLPALAGFESAVKTAAGTSFSLRIGSLATQIEKSRYTIPFGIDVGVSDWLSVGVTVPLVQDETELALDYQAFDDPNTGLSPGIGDPELVQGFLDAFGAALTALQIHRDMACATDAATTVCTSATDLATDAGSYVDALSSMYLEGFLAPVTGSVAGDAIGARLTDYQRSFGDRGVTGLPAVVPLAAEGLSSSDFSRLITDPRFGTAASAPLAYWLSPWRLGDIEFRADARILRMKWPTGEQGGEDKLRATLLVGGGVTYRLGVGAEDDPANFLDQGAGDGQDDVELRGWIQGRLGQRLGLWTDVTYTHPFEGNTFRRVHNPDILLAPRISQLPLRWTQGKSARIRVAPIYRVSDDLSLLPTYTFLGKGQDSFRYGPLVGETQALPNPNLLVPESGIRLHMMSIGLVYSTLGLEDRVGDGSPIEVRIFYHRAMAGSGGQVPRFRSFEAGFRLYRRFWGN